MPTVKRGSKAKASGAKATGSKAKGGTATKAKPAPKAASTKARRSQEDLDGMVPDFLERIKEGATLRALKQEFGFSDDGPIRAALYRAGYDRKGEEHGEEAESIGTNAAGKKQLVKLRSEGAAWYRLAFLTGLSEPEVKKLVTEAGGSSTRVYKPAAEKPKADKAKAGSKTKTKAKAKAKADPSPQA